MPARFIWGTGVQDAAATSHAMGSAQELKVLECQDQSRPEGGLKGPGAHRVQEPSQVLQAGGSPRSSRSSRE